MSLFVGNISRNISLKDLEDEFNKFGACKINHRVSATQGGYAFIEFVDDRDGEEAMLQLHGRNMGGLALNIEWSKRSPRFNIKESRVANKANKDRCYNCGKPGHISRDCKEGPECYDCGSFGHIARDCPKGIESTRKRSPRRSPRRTSSERSYSIEKSCLPAEFFPLDFVEREEKTEEKGEEKGEEEVEMEMEDGSKFVLVTGSDGDESAVYRCVACEKSLQKSSMKRHIATKTHKDRLEKGSD
jgi:hypothetical protein